MYPKLIAVIIFFSIFFIACAQEQRPVKGDGQIISQDRTLASFTNIEATGHFEVLVTDKQPPRISVIIDSNLQNAIITEIIDNTLFIHSAEGIQLKPSQTPKIIIKTASINALKCSGAVKVKVNDLKASSFSLNASGASNIVLSGKTVNFAINTSGASRIYAKGLHTRNTTIASSGSSRIKVNVTESLNITASGSTNVIYYGNPRSIKKYVSGTGKIASAATNV